MLLCLSQIPPCHLLNFAAYTDLIRLDVSWNNLSRIPIFIARLPQLRELFCRGNSLTDIECSDDFTSYENLNLLDVRENVTLVRLPHALLLRQRLRILTGHGVLALASNEAEGAAPTCTTACVDECSKGDVDHHCSDLRVRLQSPTVAQSIPNTTQTCHQHAPSANQGTSPGCENDIVSGHKQCDQTEQMKITFRTSQHPTLEQQLEPLLTDELRMRLAKHFDVPVGVTVALRSRDMVLHELCHQYARAFPPETHPAGRLLTYHQGQYVCPSLLQRLLSELRGTNWPRRQRSKLTSGEYMTLGKPPGVSEIPDIGMSALACRLQPCVKVACAHALLYSDAVTFEPG